MTTSRPTVSIVVCSVGRPAALELCLDALSHLEDVPFEVIVVLGPGAESSAASIAQRAEVATIIHSPERNLSLSRNLGADAARGDVIAFIDDDAYPIESWLADLVPAFDDPEVAATGGETLDYTGWTHQAVASWCTLAGDARPLLAQPTAGLSETPAARTFAYPIGTNLLVRTEALRAVGGFDEQFDYYHDETDLSRRLLDAGWIVRPLPRGTVFHKFLPSSIRSERRIATDRRSILVNRAYFAARHQAPDEGVEQVILDFEAFAALHRRELAEAESTGIVPVGTLAAFDGHRHEAIRRLASWLAAPPLARVHHPDPGAVEVARPRTTLTLRSSVSHIALVAPGGHASTEVEALVTTLVHEGRRVHVIEHGETHSTVDLERGAWRHRLAPGPGVDVLAGDTPPMAPLLAEVARTAATLHPLDVVVGDAADLDSLPARPERRVDIDLLARCTTAAARGALLEPS